MLPGKYASFKKKKEDHKAQRWMENNTKWCKVEIKNSRKALQYEQ